MRAGPFSRNGRNIGPIINWAWTRLPDAGASPPPAGVSTCQASTHRKRPLGGGPRGHSGRAEVPRGTHRGGRWHSGSAWVAQIVATGFQETLAQPSRGSVASGFNLHDVGAIPVMGVPDLGRGAIPSPTSSDRSRPGEASRPPGRGAIGRLPFRRSLVVLLRDGASEAHLGFVALILTSVSTPPLLGWSRGVRQDLSGPSRGLGSGVGRRCRGVTSSPCCCRS